MASHLRTELVLDALQMAIGQRRPASAVIHHSDQGSQYTSLAFGNRCKEAGVGAARPAAVDGLSRRRLRQRHVRELLATLECGLLDRRRFVPQAEVRVACFSFIKG